MTMTATQRKTKIGQTIEILESCRQMPKAAAKGMIAIACDIFGKDFMLNVMSDFGFPQFCKLVR